MRYNVRYVRLLIVIFVAGVAIGLLIGLLVGRAGGSNRGATTSSVTASSSTGSSTSVRSTTTKATSTGQTTTTKKPTTTTGAGAVTAESARAVGANEVGRIAVLAYHRITTDIAESDLVRSPDHLRSDIAQLKDAGYYPINVRDMARGIIDVPAGLSPVVLTFDDSSPGQYHLQEDGSLDPDCAVGILQAAVAEGDWAAKASFFPLLYVDPADDIVFGQPDSAEQKLKQLVSWGYEVGSHTVTHRDLSTATAEVLAKELADSASQLEAMIGGGYKVVTLCVPFSWYPDDVALLKSGEYEGKTYAYGAALEVSGEPTDSPFSSTFDAMHIQRIAAFTSSLEGVLAHFEAHPELRFVSDGDPDVISAPETVEQELGALEAPDGFTVIRY